MLKRILISGGCGFIASAFVRAFDKKYAIIVVDNLTYAGNREKISNKSYYFHHVNICNELELNKVFKMHKPDYVIHFAAESHVDNSLLNSKIFYETNILGTYNMLEMAKKHNVEKFINISTDEVYGEITQENWQEDNVMNLFYEDDELHPNSPYSVSKASADMMGQMYYRTYKTPVITVRPTNNYGAWQNREKLIPQTIYNALNDLPINIYNKGENIREWLYVDDTVNAIDLLLEKGEIGHIYNVGSKIRESNNFIVGVILKHLDKLRQADINYIEDRKGHDFMYGVNSQKIRKLGWTASTDDTLSLRFRDTINWYKEYYNRTK